MKKAFDAEISDSDGCNQGNGYFKQWYEPSCRNEVLFGVGKWRQGQGPAVPVYYDWGMSYVLFDWSKYNQIIA